MSALKPLHVFLSPNLATHSLWIDKKALTELGSDLKIKDLGGGRFAIVSFENCFYPMFMCTQGNRTHMILVAEQIDGPFMVFQHTIETCPEETWGKRVADCFNDSLGKATKKWCGRKAA